MSEPEQTDEPRYTIGSVSRILGVTEKTARKRASALTTEAGPAGWATYARDDVRALAVATLGAETANARIAAEEARCAPSRITRDDAIARLKTNRAKLSELLDGEIDEHGREVYSIDDVERIAAERGVDPPPAPTRRRRRAHAIPRPESLPARCAHSTVHRDPTQCSQCWGAAPERVLLAAAPMIGTAVRGRYAWGDGGIVPTSRHNGARS